MCDLKWVEVDPEQNDWEIQYDLVAYDGNVTIGSIVYCGEEIGWQSVIEGHMEYLEAETLAEAKDEMIFALENHCDDQINYYKELQESLDELN